MDSSSGEIRNMEDWKKLLVSPDTEYKPFPFEKLTKLIPFEIGERIEIKGCLFEIRDIKEHPENELVLKGLPKLFGLENKTIKKI